MAQIQLKARMNHKGALENMQMEFNAPRKEGEILMQEQVGKQTNASVLFFINKVELSIYRFLTSRTKMPKNSLDRSSWGSTSSLAIGAFNVW